MPLRLFLSHSSPDEASRGRLIRLVEAVEKVSGGRVVVLYDLRDVGGGNEWRPRIGYLLHAADAAVVLLDEAAIESPWVLAEATFLSFRHLHDPSFRLVPVSHLPADALAARDALAAQQARLRAGPWSPADLPALQYVTGQTPEQVGEIIVELLERDGALEQGVTIIEQLADQLAPLFQKAPPRTLNRLARELGEDVPYLTDDIATRSAISFARRLIEAGDLAEVRRLLKPFGSTYVRKYGQEIVEALAPLPVDAEAAVLLLRRRNAVGYVHAALYAASPMMMVQLYVRRAHLPDDCPRILMINATYGTVESIRAELRIELRRGAMQPIRGAQEWTPSDDLLERRLAEEPMYALLPAVDEEVLDVLSVHYPALSLIVPGHEDGGFPSVCAPLLPRMAREKEDHLLWHWLGAGGGEG